MAAFRPLTQLSAVAVALVATSHAFFRAPSWSSGTGYRGTASFILEPRATAPVTPSRGIASLVASSAMPEVSVPDVFGAGIEVQAVKSQILQLAAATERGTLATPQQREDVETLVARLQEVAPDSSGASKNEDMAGKWLLVYSSVQTYRSSPFFASFQVLVGDNAAERAFSVASAVPYAKIGQVRQVIDLEAGELLSRVDMWVWPRRLFNGVVETRARIVNDDVGERLDLIVESTGIKDSTLGRLSKRIEQWRLPLDRVFERVFDKIPRVVLETVYVDGELRVSRLPDGGLLLYVRDF